MIVYESEFTIIEFTPELKLQVQIWKEDTLSLNFTEELYKREVLANAKQVAENKTQFLISDARNFDFIVVPDLQTWTVTHFLDVLVKEPCEKYALIVGEDLFTQVSIEQTVRESKHKGVMIKYFTTIESAKEWVLPS